MTISVVLVVHNQLPLTRACLDSLVTTTLPFDLCVVDNGSTDGTEAYFREWPAGRPLRYRRNAENVGLIRALNQGAQLSESDHLCFLHNDTEMRDPRWLDRLRTAVDGQSAAGLAGLYGARRLRRDGRYVGRTIVSSLEGTGNLRAPVTEVAAVDGVCLFIARPLLAAVGGFDEGYGFFHGYDRDLSFAVREAGHRCVVVRAPFVHRGGGTRTGAEAPRPPDRDLSERREALARFARKWRHRLPTDVRRVPERIADFLSPAGRPRG
ncbi:MAG: glycosyltransferase [Candidatus Rokubacteria bacterium]|nr:glycosyltransferase [Candidatus Rokubacteria bacterium]